MNKANLPLVYSLGGLGCYTVLSYSCHRCYSLHNKIGRLNTEVQLLVHSRSVCIRKIHWFRIFFDQSQSPVIPEASENPHTIHILWWYIWWFGTQMWPLERLASTGKFLPAKGGTVSFLGGFFGLSFTDPYLVFDGMLKLCFMFSVSFSAKYLFLLSNVFISYAIEVTWTQASPIAMSSFKNTNTHRMASVTENAHFQHNVWGFLEAWRFQRFRDHRALTLI